MTNINEINENNINAIVNISLPKFAAHSIFVTYMSFSTLYSQISKTKSKIISVSVQLNKNHEMYKGHFPNQPVTAGAALLQILKNLVEDELQMKLSMKELSNVKYLTPVDPNVNNILVFNFSIEEEGEAIKIKNTTTFPDGREVMKCRAYYSPLLLRS